MTEQDTVKLLTVIDTYYSRTKVGDKELKMIISLWYNSFKDFEFSVVFNLLQQHIEMGVPFAPKISDLKEIYYKTFDKGLDCGEAWEQVMRVMRKYGYYNAGEGLSQLDELTKKALNSIGGYMYLCSSENNIMSDRARFMDNYKIYAQRKREDLQLGVHKQKLVQLVEDTKVDSIGINQILGGENIAKYKTKQF